MPKTKHLLGIHSHLLGPIILGPGPIGPIHLLGPVGPIPRDSFVGPGRIGPIHLLGPVGAILGGGGHDKWGPNEGWGAVRHIKRSGISIRFFFTLQVLLLTLQKLLLSCPDLSCPVLWVFISV